MGIKITATVIVAADLQPGDLFSSYPQEYWDNIDNMGSIGERVYIRTNAPAEQATDANSAVFKITIQTGAVAPPEGAAS